MSWTIEELNQAITMAARGNTMREIAAVLKKSRNSVIGKLNRTKVRPAPVVRLLKPRRLGKPLSAHKTDECLYSLSRVSPHRFCCKPVATGYAYCEAHARMCYAGNLDLDKT